MKQREKDLYQTAKKTCLSTNRRKGRCECIDCDLLWETYRFGCVCACVFCVIPVWLMDTGGWWLTVGCGIAEPVVPKTNGCDNIGILRHFPISLYQLPFLWILHSIFTHMHSCTHTHIRKHTEPFQKWEELIYLYIQCIYLQFEN